MAQDTNYAYPLAQFALTNNPTMISNKNASFAGMFPGSWGFGDDPNKKILSQQAPTTLNDPHPIDVIGGAVGKALGDARSFGGVNTTAHNSQMGQPSNDQKPGFWDSKGGSILSSLLGVIALGGLGAGIGAISGGGRGAARGASYGMGLGTLQDLALRKQGMEAPANVAKNELELEKIKQSGIPSDARMFSMYQNMPPEQQKAFQQYKLDTNPYAGLGIQLRQDANLNKQIQGLSEDLKTTQGVMNAFDNINNQLGFDINKYDEKTNTVQETDPKTGNIVKKQINIPGSSIPGIGRVWSLSREGSRLGADVQQLESLQIYDRTGKAINIPELENFKFEMGHGRFNTEADFLASYKKAYRAVQKKVQNIEAGYSPEAVTTYKGRGGSISVSQPSPQMSPDVSSAQPTGDYQIIDQAAYDELMRRRNRQR